MVLVSHYLSAWVVVFALLGSALSCNMRWLRYVYMMTCGERKRAVLWWNNDTSVENPPRQFDDALDYFGNDPSSSDALLREMLEEDDSDINSDFLLNANGEIIYAKELLSQNAKESSVLMKKLFPNLGWNNEYILRKKVNKKRKTRLDELIDECCGLGPRKNCTTEMFRGAC